MNKALNTGYSATSASSYGPGIVNPPSNFIPQGSTAPMTPIDNRSFGKKIVDSLHDGITGLDHGTGTLGHIEDQGLRIAGLGYGLSKLRGPGGGLLRRFMPPAFDELVPLAEAGIEMAPLAIV